MKTRNVRWLKARRYFEYLRRLRKKGITDALVPRAAERTLERFPGRHY